MYKSKIKWSGTSTSQNFYWYESADSYEELFSTLVDRGIMNYDDLEDHCFEKEGVDPDSLWDEEGNYNQGKYEEVMNYISEMDDDEWYSFLKCDCRGDAYYQYFKLLADLKVNGKAIDDVYYELDDSEADILDYIYNTKDIKAGDVISIEVNGYVYEEKTITDEDIEYLY